jgi:arylsulfatase A-like enzyme
MKPVPRPTLLAGLCCLLALQLPLPWLRAQPAPAANKPNIILINLDDADYELLSPDNLAVYYPHLGRFSRDGLHLANFHVTTPLCGPSRAALFTALYAHRNGIRTNDPFARRSNGFDGGMVAYRARGHFDNDLGTWMQAAGYRTMMVGKFLHSDTVDIVPRGWDDFYSSRGANYFATSRFTNATQSAGQAYIEPLSTYRTVKECDEALDLIDRHMARDNGQPFFLYLAPLAPHHQTPRSETGMIEERYRDLWPKALMPKDRDFQEADFSDKSTAIRDLPLLTKRQLSRIDEHYRERVVALKSVDDMFAALTGKLQQQGLADKTWILLTSDNGFSNGHHRMIGKGDPFDQSTHVPTYVLGPGVPAGETANHLLAHIDLAPTIVELAGGQVPDHVDGKSFAALLLEPQNHDPRSWRESVLIENWETRTLQNRDFNTAGLALRFFDSVYVEWASGSPEFYDLSSDPRQLQNLYDNLPAEEKESLAGKLMVTRSHPQEPITTISHPFRMNDVHGRLTPFQGMAECAGGVGGVDVVLRRFSDYRYWNGASWQTQPARLAADLANPGQILTSWSYAGIPAGQPADDLLGIQAIARGKRGNHDADPPWIIFRLDHSCPQAEIQQPETVGQIMEEFRIKGTASDEGEIDHVRLVIRNRDTGRYWNGHAWTNAWTFVRISVRRSGRWNYYQPGLAGSFDASVRAVDVSGNVQSPPARTSFRVHPIDE